MLYCYLIPVKHVDLMVAYIRESSDLVRDAGYRTFSFFAYSPLVCLGELGIII
jgi:hypothetical protein